MASRNDQCAVRGTKGISDAVRGAVHSWITDELADILYAEYMKQSAAQTLTISRPSFRLRLQNSESWKRYARGNDPNGDGFYRKYYSKEFGRAPGKDPNVVLQVLTNQDDTKIKYVTFTVNKKMIYGGSCDVPSAILGQYGYSYALSKTVNWDVKGNVGFLPFTPAQLQKLAVDLEYSSIGMIEQLIAERV